MKLLYIITYWYGLSAHPSIFSSTYLTQSHDEQGDKYPGQDTDPSQGTIPHTLKGLSHNKNVMITEAYYAFLWNAGRHHSAWRKPLRYGNNM